jgi:N-acetylglucosaminyl-diphospho-decaprenol L-rhamnosyltransferase
MTLPITAVLVTYNSAAVIGDALASLPPGLPAIVVDNASKDDSADIARSHGATVIQRHTNNGFGVANNYGITTATTPYILLLNPDARLRSGCLERLLAAADRHPEAWMLVPSLYQEEGTRFEKWETPVCLAGFIAAGLPDPAVRSVCFASGAVILLRRDRILGLSGFDPELFLYFEDDDLSRRVLDQKGLILHVPDAAADHAGNSSSPPSLQMIEMKHWHLAWSERYVRRKHRVAVWSRWRLVESAVKLLWAQLRRDKAEQAKQLGLLNGTFAGLRGVRAQQVRENVDAGSES